MVTVAAADRPERHRKGKGLAVGRTLVPSGRSPHENGHSDETDDHPSE
jgi:hypothetical protein